METSKLKIFATEARKKLMRGVKHRLRSLGFDLATGEPKEMPQLLEGGAVLGGTVVSEKFYEQWMSLYRNVKSRTIEAIAEEAAYTWFNRLMAIRIMSKQGFISPVLDYEDDTVHVPLIVAEARQGRLPVMNEAERIHLMEIINDDNRTAEQFAILIVAFCHDTPIINRCFGAIADYTELLLPQDILADAGFVDMINHSSFITDEQYASAELIGWLYQFYISDRKDEAFSKSGKYDANDIAPATQIFTPNWIVKYLVQNTVGRICIDNGLADSESETEWKHLVEKDKKGNTIDVTDITELKVADLACGSGHILNECFDLLYSVYIAGGHSRSDAVKNIFTKNLLGIDLDTRAKQLATFALLMKACKCDESFKDAHIMPRVYDMPRPITEVLPDWFRNAEGGESIKKYIGALFNHYLMGATKQMQQELADAVYLMNDADMLGSIMEFDLSETTRNALMIRTAEYDEMLAMGDRVPEPSRIAMRYARIILALTDDYSAICMNPPYMGSGRFDATLSKYVKDHYVDGKADLFAVFMQVAINRLADGGKYGMINMHSWMFLSSFERLRCTLLKEQTIDSLLHLGARTFDELSGEVVQNAAFVITNNKPFKQLSQYNENTGCEETIRRYDASATYFRLIDGRDCSDKERMFLDAKANHTEKVYYEDIAQSNFETIPGSPIGYWVSKIVIEHFSQELIGDNSVARSGFSTGNNSIYIRNWHEISLKEISFKSNSVNDYNKSGCKYIPFTAGGSFRRWYGNQYCVVDWTDTSSMHRPRTTYSNLYCKEGVTWNEITTDSFSCRYYPKGFLFEHSGVSLFPNETSDIYYYVAFLNTKILSMYLRILNPTLHNGAEVVAKVPFVVSNKEYISKLAKQCVNISKEDWDAHETSWDFKANELITIDENSYLEIAKDYSEFTKIEFKQHLSVPKPESIEWHLNWYKTKWDIKFRRLLHNEIELNRQFIEIYGLQDELHPLVYPRDITILQQGEKEFIPAPGDDTRYGNTIFWHDDVLIKQFISYAVGCMMGRYSIDKPRLILANQGDDIERFNELVPNSRFEVDDDGIIPLMPSDTWFNDNATLRFKRFVATVFGEATLNENLNFIEKSLGKNVDTYFVKDFWKDHKKMYQKRPIYWLFSSKNGAFQCLAYMHRMNAYTAERVRSKYLLPHIEWLVNKAKDLEEAPLLNSMDRRELDTLHKQIAECREYHDLLHEIADKQIAFDLDDGVTVNYAKFGDALASLR